MRLQRALADCAASRPDLTADFDRLRQIARDVAASEKQVPPLRGARGRRASWAGVAANTARLRRMTRHAGASSERPSSAAVRAPPFGSKFFARRVHQRRRISRGRAMRSPARKQPMERAVDDASERGGACRRDGIEMHCKVEVNSSGARNPAPAPGDMGGTAKMTTSPGERSRCGQCQSRASRASLRAGSDRTAITFEAQRASRLRRVFSAGSTKARAKSLRPETSGGRSCRPRRRLSECRSASKTRRSARRDPYSTRRASTDEKVDRRPGRRGREIGDEHAGRRVSHARSANSRWLQLSARGAPPGDEEPTTGPALLRPERPALAGSHVGKGQFADWLPHPLLARADQLSSSPETSNASFEQKVIAVVDLRADASSSDERRRPPARGCRALMDDDRRTRDPAQRCTAAERPEKPRRRYGPSGARFRLVLPRACARASPMSSLRGAAGVRATPSRLVAAADPCLRWRPATLTQLGKPGQHLDRSVKFEWSSAPHRGEVMAIVAEPTGISDVAPVGSTGRA